MECRIAVKRFRPQIFLELRSFYIFDNYIFSNNPADISITPAASLRGCVSAGPPDQVTLIK
jgi:hypothetical protein